MSAAYTTYKRWHSELKKELTKTCRIEKMMPEVSRCKLHITHRILKQQGPTV